MYMLLINNCIIQYTINDMTFCNIIIIQFVYTIQPFAFNWW